MIKFAEKHCGGCCMNGESMGTCSRERVVYIMEVEHVWHNRVGEYFEVRSGLRQGCVRSMCLFKIFFDRVVTRLNGRPMGRGVKLRDENGGCWEIKQALYADDTVLVAEAREHLQHIANEFERVCDSMVLKINIGLKRIIWGVVRTWEWMGRKCKRGSSLINVKLGDIRRVDRVRNSIIREVRVWVKCTGMNSEFNCWGVREPTLVLFFFYLNASEMLLWSCLSSQPLTIMDPWLILHVEWFIPVVHPGWLPPVSLREIGRLS